MNTLNDVLMNEILERNARKSSNSTISNTCREKALSKDGQELERLLLRCLKESTESVFETMCGWELTSHEPIRGEGFSPRHDISGIISLGGELKATVVVSIGLDLIYSASESILGLRPSEVNADVIDLVGEIANMIGGNAKERLSMPNVTLGLPTVVAGAGHYIAHNSHMEISMLPFDCPSGELSVELGIA